MERAQHLQLNINTKQMKGAYGHVSKNEIVLRKEPLPPPLSLLKQNTVVQ